jgi:hypothetical protein
MSRLASIHELRGQKAVGVAPPRRGKIDVILARTGARDITDFVRKLLNESSNERFQSLIKTAKASLDDKTLKIKTDSISRMLRHQVSKNRLSVEYAEAIAEYCGFTLEGEQGRIWRTGTADQFSDMLEKSLKRDAPVSSDPPARRQPPAAENLESQRISVAWSLLSSLCSIILFGNQGGCRSWILS